MKKEFEYRHQLHSIIAACHGVRLESSESPSVAKASRPKSDAEFESKLMQAGFTIKYD